MTTEDFKNFLNERGCKFMDPENPKYTPGMKLLGFNLSVSLLREGIVGVHFYSGTKLERISQLNGPWLAAQLLRCFADMEGVGVYVPKRKKGDEIKGEGHAAECFLSEVKFDDKSDEDLIKRFGEKLAQFLLDAFSDKKAAEGEREKFNRENADFVRTYAERRIASGEGLSQGELVECKISETKQKEEKMKDAEASDFVEPCFWKFSYKTEYGELAKDKWEEYKSQNKIVMQKPKSQSKNPTTEDYQRELFLYSLRKGDYVCIWEEGKVSLLVKIIDEDREMQAPGSFEGKFVERTYELIARVQPNGTLEMCAPNGDTMFARVSFQDRRGFADQILRPCFGVDEKRLQELLSSRIAIKYWVFTSSSDKNKRGNEWDGFSKMDLNDQDFYYVYSKGKDGNRDGRRSQAPAYIGCREGDIMLGYDGAPDMKVCALLRCSSVPYLDTAYLDKEAKIYFEKKVHLDTPVEQGKLKECGITIPTQTSMFSITREQYENFMVLARKENPNMDESVLHEAGSVVLNDEEKKISALLDANFNVILTGAPGTGKTYMAKRVAMNLAKDEWVVDKSGKGKWENGRIASVQFHPGYDYSDFVIGMKPVLLTEDGKEVKKKDGKYFLDGTETEVTELGKAQVSFRWKDGIFKEFAYTAKDDPTHNYVFLIDEINRADLSRVFGELFSLLEEEYRYPNENGTGITLPNGEDFVIPKNLYIIGTMNDIDRSVESMDFALRRRFAWLEVKPEDTADDILAKVPEKQELRKKMDDVNGLIRSEDFRLGCEYQLGGAIFAKFKGSYEALWENHIKNILSEYLRGRSGRKDLLKKLKDAYDGKKSNS